MCVCVLCSWKQTQLSTFGKETSRNTRVRWQMLRQQGTRPCCPLPGTWTVSPTARTGAAITRLTRRISRVCADSWFASAPPSANHAAWLLISTRLLMLGLHSSTSSRGYASLSSLDLTLSADCWRRANVKDLRRFCANTFKPVEQT